MKPGSTGSLPSGLLFAAVSALSFGLSGSIAKGLLNEGWSPGAAVAVRMAIAGTVLMAPAVMALSGRWELLRGNLKVVLFYGLTAVALAQFAYFSAVQYLDVALALLLEYTAPLAVVIWMWLRHGQRPTLLTWLGAAVAGLGLVLVLGLINGAGSVSGLGVGWALLAMVGAAAYFVISADTDNGLPGLVLACGGLLVGAGALAVLGMVDLVPLHATTAVATYVPFDLPWWLALLVLGLITAAVAYVTGIAAGRRLGSRLASFVALSEVLASVLWAWWLLAELPTTTQGLGGVAILGGIILVKLGEPKHDVLADPH